MIGAILLALAAPDTGSAAGTEASWVSGSVKLNLRRGASTEYKIIGSVTRDQPVTVLGSEDGWTHVRLEDGREGWIEWTPGIGSFKDPDSFGILSLVATLPPTDDPVPDPLPDEVVDTPPDASVDVVEDLATDTTTDVPVDGPGPDYGPPGDPGGCSCSLI